MERLYALSKTLGGQAVCILFIIYKNGTINIDSIPGMCNAIGPELEEIIDKLQEFKFIEFLGDRNVRCVRGIFD